jgi:hypothetical protein
LTRFFGFGNSDLQGYFLAPGASGEMYPNESRLRFTTELQSTPTHLNQGSRCLPRRRPKQPRLRPQHQPPMRMLWQLTLRRNRKPRNHKSQRTIS